MKNIISTQEIIIGGICGVIGTLCYLFVITISMPPAITFVVAMSFPILSIVASVILYKYIAIHKQSLSNQLAFLFICIAFILMSVMLSSQLPVRISMLDDLAKVGGNEKDLLKHISRSLRRIDQGFDLGWDMFIGVGLLFLSNAIKNHPKFGLKWSTPLALLSILVIVINLVAFPYPPDTVELIDIGPFVGLFMICLFIKLMIIGVKMKKNEK